MTVGCHKYKVKNAATFSPHKFEVNDLKLIEEAQRLILIQKAFCQLW